MLYDVPAQFLIGLFLKIVGILFDLLSSSFAIGRYIEYAQCGS